MLELLSPAGSLDALHAAVCNGADGLSGRGGFNARAGARNFTLDELPEAVRYCHVRGVRVYLTLNTLVTDRELPKVAEHITAAARAGVDALIVQDLGVAALSRQIAPQLALHASTQLTVHSLEGVRSLPRSAFRASCSRASFRARRSPISAATAPCASRSSSTARCALLFRPVLYVGRYRPPLRQPRPVRPALPPAPTATAGFENRYPMSLKDNCLIRYLGELARMGVASLKLEGRMKRPGMSPSSRASTAPRSTAARSAVGPFRAARRLLREGLHGGLLSRPHGPADVRHAPAGASDRELRRRPRDL